MVTAAPESLTAAALAADEWKAGTSLQAARVTCRAETVTAHHTTVRHPSHACISSCACTHNKRVQAQVQAATRTPWEQFHRLPHSTLYAVACL